MENTIAAIELGSKKIKLVIGYELNGKVYPIFALTKPYGQLIQDNNFFDYNKLLETINSIKFIKDQNGNPVYSIKECVLCLPPDGLKIFRTSQRTPVVSEHEKISILDIKNLYSLVKNSGSFSEDVLVDIVPEEYTLDDNRTVTGNPVGDIAHTLVLRAKVHLSPEHIYKNYTGIVEKADIQIKRTVISSLAAVEYLATFGNVPANYLLVDVGSGTTTVSLIGKNALFGSKSFSFGGDNITNAIAENFRINFADAEKYKIIYGIDEREMTFKAPICSCENEIGEKIDFYREDLNKVIKSSLAEFADLLSKNLTELLEKHNPELRKLPIVCIGGASQLKGFVPFLSQCFETNIVKTVTPNTIGARDLTYFNCLGMILVSNKYMSLNDENKLRTKNMTRD